MLLAFNQHVSIPILSSCWPLPQVWRHAVQDRPGHSESLRHHLCVTFVKAIDVLAYRRHRIFRAYLVTPSSLALANRNADDALMSLHLVEHVGEGGLELQRLLDLVGTHIGIFPIFEEARDLMLADKLDEILRLGFPIFGKAFEVFENSINAGGREERHSVLGVLVEVCVEDALIHEVGLPVDRKEDPAQVVQLEHGETVRLRRYGLLDVFGILVEHLLPTGDDFRKNRKAVAGWTLGKDRAVSALFHLILGESSFGNRHR